MGVGDKQVSKNCLKKLKFDGLSVVELLEKQLGSISLFLSSAKINLSKLFSWSSLFNFLHTHFSLQHKREHFYTHIHTHIHTHTQTHTHTHMHTHKHIGTHKHEHTHIIFLSIFVFIKQEQLRYALIVTMDSSLQMRFIHLNIVTNKSIFFKNYQSSVIT